MSLADSADNNVGLMLITANFYSTQYSLIDKIIWLQYVEYCF